MYRVDFAMGVEAMDQSTFFSDRTVGSQVCKINTVELLLIYF